MNILALEPYYGGSHRAFLDRWVEGSRHQWKLLTLPAHHWKWRMRHAAVTFAEQATALRKASFQWDAVFCSDMLSLAEWQGLCGDRCPAVLYFHENQLTYPVQHPDDRDLHFAFANIISAVAADQIWFNSAFHQGEFLDAAANLLQRMPDHQSMANFESLRKKSQVQWPGCPAAQCRPPATKQTPLHIAWAARWEYDKGPGTFAQAIHLLLDQQTPFTLSLMGETFRATPPEFEALLERLRSDDSSGSLLHQGFQTRETYTEALEACDVFVSTAEHEFFGLSVVEAIAAGAVPVLPWRLSYPEILGPALQAHPQLRDQCFYDGTPQQLAARLQLIATTQQDSQRLVACAQDAVRPFAWPERIDQMDAELDSLADTCR